MVGLVFNSLELVVGSATYTKKFTEQNVVVNCSFVFISKLIFITIILTVAIILVFIAVMVSITVFI